MHIADGVLSVPVLAVGSAAAAAGVAAGLWRLDYERIPRVAVLSSAFFVASLIHVPIGPTSAHLILSGLAGLILGWAAFPAILVALLLQAMLFGFGGLTTLGVNTVNMAVPAVVCYYLFGRGVRSGSPALVFGAGGAAGAFAVALGCAMASLALLASGREFLVVAEVFYVSHIPIIVAEGLVTGSAAAFLRKVRPELLRLPEYARLREGVEHA